MENTETSGYHTAAQWIHALEHGAWRLEIGYLPDGRFCVDYLNSYNGQRTRHYFNTEEAARYEALAFVGKGQ